VPGKDGWTMRAKYEDLERRSGKPRAELDVGPFPEGTEHIVSYFGDIAMGRGSNGFGPSYLTASEVLAWSQLTGTRLSPWEFRSIRALDRAWMKAWSEMNKPDE
jgi:hypothetical protein